MPRCAAMPLAIECGPAQPPSAAVLTPCADDLRGDGTVIPSDRTRCRLHSSGSPASRCLAAQADAPMPCGAPRRDSRAPCNTLETRSIQEIVRRHTEDTRASYTSIELSRLASAVCMVGQTEREDRAR